PPLRRGRSMSHGACGQAPPRFQPKRPMLKRNLWKLVLCLAILAWSVSQLIPVQDVPFPDYIREHTTAKQAEFRQLVDEAVGRVRNGQAPSEFVALRQIGSERKIDLSQYFPD